MNIYDLFEIKKGQKDSNGNTRCWPGKHAEGTKKGKNGGPVRNCVSNESVNEGFEIIHEYSVTEPGDSGVEEGNLKEFAPNGGGDDGFSEETLKRLAAQWWQGDEDPRIEKTLMAAGWEIGQDEGYDNGGVFVVQAGDVNGNSYISWPAEELEQGVAEGSEHEGLVLQFLKSITPKELRYYSIRDNCGPAALHMMDWAKEKGIELHRVNGYFVADNVVYDKADFTKEMKHEFLQQGLDFNDPKSRQEFIASNPKYSKEWKKVPHYWLQDDRGTVYDPTGYIQFIKTGLAKDLDKSRYETVQGVAESLRPGEYHVWTVHFEDGTKGRIRVPNDEITDDQIKAHYAKRGKTVVKIDADWAVHSLDEAPVSNFMTAPQQPIDPREQWKRQVRAMAAQYQRNPSMLASLAKEAGPDSVEQVAWEYLQSAAKGIRMPGADTQPAPVNWDDVIRRLPQGLSGQALLNAAEEYLTGTKGMLRSQVRTLLNEPTNQRSLKGAYDRKLQPSESIDELAEAIDSRLYAMKLAGYEIL